MNNVLKSVFGKRSRLSGKTSPVCLILCVAFASIAVAQTGQQTNNQIKPQNKAASQPGKAILQPVRTYRGQAPATATATAAATKPSADGKYPKIRCDNPVYEFSSVWGGEKVEHTFTIHNDGNAPLEITNISPGCGCTVVKDYQRTIPPGGQTDLTFTVTTSTAASKKTVTPAIETNDPQTPAFRLTITGTVNLRIAIEPPTGADWGTIQKDQKLGPRQVKITNNTATAMKLQPVRALESDHFTSALKETEPGKVYELTVTPKEPFKEGDNREYIYFQTGVPDQPQINILCHVYSTPLVEASSAINISLSNPLAKNRRTGMTYIKYNGDGEMKILSATSDHPAIKVEIKTQKAGKLYYVIAEIGNDYKPNPLKHPPKITVTTDVKKEPVVIPVVITGLQQPDIARTQPSATQLK